MKLPYLFCTSIIAGLLTLISCSDDNANKPLPEPKPVTAKVNYVINNNADVKKLLDVELTYTDADGKSKTIQVTTIPYTATLTDVVLPFKASMTVTYKRLTNLTLTQQTYKLAPITDAALQINYSTSDGQLVSSSNSSSVTVDKTQVETWLEHYGLQGTTPKVLSKNIEIKATETNE